MVLLSGFFSCGSYLETCERYAALAQRELSSKKNSNCRFAFETIHLNRRFGVPSDNSNQGLNAK